MAVIKRMSIAEFRSEGYLQELNRRFLHPLGLAMEVVVGPDGHETLGGVWDSRDDPEGVIYGGNAPDPEKAKHIRHLEEARKPARLEQLGYWIQPADR